MSLPSMHTDIMQATASRRLRHVHVLLGRFACVHAIAPLGRRAGTRAAVCRRRNHRHLRRLHVTIRRLAHLPVVAALGQRADNSGRGFPQDEQPLTRHHVDGQHSQAIPNVGLINADFVKPERRVLAALTMKSPSQAIQDVVLSSPSSCQLWERKVDDSADFMERDNVKSPAPAPEVKESTAGGPINAHGG